MEPQRSITKTRVYFLTESVLEHMAIWIDLNYKNLG